MTIAIMEDDIAVVGISLKLPQGVNDVSEFWDVLENRRNLMTTWPESRINSSFFESKKVCGIPFQFLNSY